MTWSGLGVSQVNYPFFVFVICYLGDLDRLVGAGTRGDGLEMVFECDLAAIWLSQSRAPRSKSLSRR